MARRNDGEDAVAQTVAFIVAAAFFLGILGTLVVATADAPGSDDQGAQDASNRLDAEHLADLLTGSAGIGWEGGADGVTRLGLQHDDGDRLDDTRLDALRGAAYDADGDNGKVDYEEALEGLGMSTDETVGFHIRMAPVGLQKALQAADLSHIRTAYIADWKDTDRSFTVLHTTDALMLADARLQVEATIGDQTQAERDVLVDVGLGYDDEVNLHGFDIKAYDPVFDTYTPLADAVSDPSLLDGDLYIDDKYYLSHGDASPDPGVRDALLESRLDDYDLLIVGSTVDHPSLTSQSVKEPIADWVQAGGTLMVLGSTSQNFQWLEPLFSVGTTTVNAAPAAPDVSHPMLHEPWELDWTSYENFGQAWNLKEEGAKASHDKFQHIITSDGEDVLAVSNEGAFGDGRVFLTSYRAEEIATDQSALEATNFLSNMVLYSDRADLYLDYGPTPPDVAAVSAAVRTTQIYDEDLGMVSIRITVLYWGV